jgi:hypothetical protein
MIVSEKYNYAFISTRKCGTNSIYPMLEKYFDGHHVGERMHGFEPNLRPPNAYVFGVCRNPYDQVCSIYKSLFCGTYKFKQYLHDELFKKQTVTFETFLSYLKGIQPMSVFEKVQIHKMIGVILLSQTEWLRWHRQQIDQFIRLENLEDEVKTLPFYTGQPFEVYRLNVSNTPRTPLLTPKTIEMINDIRREDFKYFGYPMRDDKP